LSQGQAGEALSIYGELWRINRQRKRIGALTNLLVRALVEVGEVEEALEVAERALELTRGLNPLKQRARLAYGMALSSSDAERAIPLLEGLLSDFGNPLLAERLAQAGLYLARAYLLTGDSEKARTALARAEPGLKELGESGFRYLAGPPEAFHGVLALLQGEVPSLELRFLGRIEARLRGRSLSLRPRFAELLTALALHPEGLSGEQITLAVYGEFGDVRRCAVEVGRLKQLVPLRSRPYKLDISVSVDFLKLGDLIQSNRLLEALELYRGALLPQSDAPLVTETRAFLEESLRQAVVASNDPEAHWILAQRLEDDLDVWDKTLTLLDESDPRTVIARARVKGLLESYGV
jgi:tetratricopeptide (TPR) repeat protein